MGNTQLHHLIKKIYELIEKDKRFFDVVPLDGRTPEADMSDWKDRLPWDHRYAPNDGRQQRFCVILYHRESLVLQFDYQFGHSVSPYLREAFEHKRDAPQDQYRAVPDEDRKWSETLSQELFPDVISNMHYLMCKNVDDDCYCKTRFGCNVIEVLC
ncbi:hypothetical protein RHGRI_000766 [Rhododendron griersonianum]|uniref:Uncharacterized protein n=1 Tax=Rhododendron griersonianum TaxID=479676 RepID=A0AAV6LHV4_9ERIC|nr:hypothetical protein RHGRI_000766 [Rhododendron griersonianum]